MKYNLRHKKWIPSWQLIIIIIVVVVTVSDDIYFDSISVLVC